MIQVPGSMNIEIFGPGIVFYSPDFARHIPPGSNFLRSDYSVPEKVEDYIQAGTIVGFGTGSPGRYILNFQSGYPDEKFFQDHKYQYRLGLHCVGGVVCFRDLYDLISWEPECDPAQALELRGGYYHVTLCSNRPVSGILGDNQTINVFLEPLSSMPPLARNGIPILCAT